MPKGNWGANCNSNGSGQGPVASSLGNLNQLLDFIKGGNFLDLLKVSFGFLFCAECISGILMVTI
jgi:hypothetical protein